MENERRHANVVKLDEVEGRTSEAGSKFGCSVRRLGSATGAAGIGCCWYEVAPGRSAFPRHYHCANEESLFVLEGQGSLRIGEDEVALRAGDYVTFPVGPKHAHRLLATGSSPLRYLCLSTMHSTEAVGYPDSKKIGVLSAASYASAMRGEHWIRLIAPDSPSAGYYDGEDID